MTVKLQNPDSRGNDKQVNTGGFSVLALVFQFLLYLGHGMWKKGLVLLAILLLSALAIDVITTNPEEIQALRGGVGILLALYSGLRFNADYYKHLKAKGWKQAEAIK